MEFNFGATILLLLFVSNRFVPVKKRVVCFYNSWSHYRDGDANFEVTDIDTSLCTHLIYNFLKMDEHEVTTTDNWLDTPFGLDNLNKFTALKTQNLKVLASVGGWNAGSEQFSYTAADPQLREEFVTSVIYFCKDYNFDGFDMNWQYPTQREGSKPEDKENFVILLQELFVALKAHGLILSVTVGASPYQAKLSYDILSIAKCVDFINLMTFNFNGHWNGRTGFNSPLYSYDDNNIEKCINYWLNQGAPAEKLNMGIPFYGRSFKLANKKKTELGAKTVGPGSPGVFSKEAGYLGYVEICMDNFTSSYDVVQHSVYGVSGTQWVGYDDPKSIYYKTQFINTYRLGGAMVWSLDGDDYRGICKKGKYPLLTALNEGLTTKSEKIHFCMEDGIFRNELNPDEFYHCVSGMAYLVQCPPGLTFDPIMERCQWKKLKRNLIEKQFFDGKFKLDLIKHFWKF